MKAAHASRLVAYVYGQARQRSTLQRKCVNILSTHLAISLSVRASMTAWSGHLNSSPSAALRMARCLLMILQGCQSLTRLSSTLFRRWGAWTAGRGWLHLPSYHAEVNVGPSTLPAGPYNDNSS